MKVKTALKQSKAHAKFLGVVLVVLLGLLAFFPNKATAIITILVAVFFAGEIINVLYIGRKARTNADYLEERIN